jgi:hypothetical protein
MSSRAHRAIAVCKSSFNSGKRLHNTQYVAHDAPRILNAGIPSRCDSSLTKIFSMPHSFANAGNETSGVAAYDGSRL